MAKKPVVHAFRAGANKFLCGTTRDVSGRKKGEEAKPPKDMYHEAPTAREHVTCESCLELLPTAAK